jgi:hypothetical protein
VLLAESFTVSLHPNLILERVENSTRVWVVIRIFRVPPNTNPIRLEEISSEDSADMIAAGSLFPFGKRTVCADFAGSRGDVARTEGTNGWISIRIWALN